jgi:hypothetical protein
LGTVSWGGAATLGADGSGASVGAGRHEVELKHSLIRPGHIQPIAGQHLDRRIGADIGQPILEVPLFLLTLGIFGSRSAICCCMRYSCTTIPLNNTIRYTAKTASPQVMTLTEER